ncbi:hypothetical protein TNCV_253921 [Trichonephila clavipes]|nr:hypothetical protein TNCV_253921 [Trichonephila clavipes]
MTGEWLEENNDNVMDESPDVHTSVWRQCIQDDLLTHSWSLKGPFFGEMRDRGAEIQEHRSRRELIVLQRERHGRKDSSRVDRIMMYLLTTSSVGCSSSPVHWEGGRHSSWHTCRVDRPSQQPDQAAVIEEVHDYNEVFNHFVHDITVKGTADELLLVILSVQEDA